mmetsp:Transcript_37912/g.38601  ORF Transcript_37912/g.38601 Transcript_37912/m.38601 type:complete len:196 (+) Transcript_37912:150-737(+)
MMNPFGRPLSPEEEYSSGSSESEHSTERMHFYNICYSRADEQRFYNALNALAEEYEEWDRRAEVIKKKSISRVSITGSGGVVTVPMNTNSVLERGNTPNITTTSSSYFSSPSKVSAQTSAPSLTPYLNIEEGRSDIMTTNTKTNHHKPYYQSCIMQSNECKDNAGGEKDSISDVTIQSESTPLHITRALSLISDE